MGIEKDRRLDAALAEYQSLREESSQARQAQQSILSWSLGVIVIVVGAAAATADKSSNGVDLMRLGVAGFVLPGLIFGASLAWAGELIRMERVGFYLRGRERGFWTSDTEGAELFDPGWIADVESRPTLWETFIAFGGGFVGQKKQPHGYIGGLIIYCGSLLLSLFVFGWLLHHRAFDKADSELTWAGYGWGIFALIVGWGTLLQVSWSLMGLSKRAAGRSSRKPVVAPGNGPVQPQ